MDSHDPKNGSKVAATSAAPAASVPPAAEPVAAAQAESPADSAGQAASTTTDQSEMDFDPIELLTAMEQSIQDWKKQQVSESQVRKSLGENCKKLNLTIHGDIPGDGNCFFSAISDQITLLGLPLQSAKELRQSVVGFLRSHPNVKSKEGIIDFQAIHRDWAAYCDKMARDGEWADHVVLVATAYMLQRDIIVVTSSPQGSTATDPFIRISCGTSCSREPFLLGHVWESHYESLQKVDDIANGQFPTGEAREVNFQLEDPMGTRPPQLENLELLHTKLAVQEIALQDQIQQNKEQQQKILQVIKAFSGGDVPVATLIGEGITERPRTSRMNKSPGTLANRPPSKKKTDNVRKRRTKCGKCNNCSRDDCRECKFCKDMKKYGGLGKMKQSCIMKKCSDPQLPSNARCYICKKTDRSDPDNTLMECHECNEVTHPECLRIEGHVGEGTINLEMGNSWECPKCCAGEGSKQNSSKDIPVNTTQPLIKHEDEEAIIAQESSTSVQQTESEQLCREANGECEDEVPMEIDESDDDGMMRTQPCESHSDPQGDQRDQEDNELAMDKESEEDNSMMRNRKKRGKSLGQHRVKNPNRQNQAGHHNELGVSSVNEQNLIDNDEYSQISHMITNDYEEEEEEEEECYIVGIVDNDVTRQVGKAEESSRRAANSEHRSGAENRSVRGAEDHEKSIQENFQKGDKRVQDEGADEEQVQQTNERVQDKDADERQPHEADSGPSNAEQESLVSDVNLHSDSQQSLYSTFTDDDYYDALLEQSEDNLDINENKTIDQQTICETSNTAQQNVNGNQHGDGAHLEWDNTLPQGEADDDNTIIDYDAALGMASVRERDDEGELNLSQAEQQSCAEVNPPAYSQPVGEVSRQVELGNVSEGVGRPVNQSDGLKSTENAVTVSMPMASASCETSISGSKENEPSVSERFQPAMVNPVSLPAANATPTKELHPEHFWKWVLSWNCERLMRGMHTTNISAILSKCPYKTLKDVPREFRSMDHYYEVFIPHLLVETWAKLCKDYDAAANRQMKCVLTRAPVKEAKYSGFVMECKVSVFIPQDKNWDSKFLSEEDFVIISPHPDRNHRTRSVFGVVLHIGQQTQRSFSGDKAPRICREVTLLTGCHFQGSCEQQFNLQVMGSLVTASQQFHAVKSFHKSPLARDILRFRRMDVFCCDNTRRQRPESVIPCTSTKVTDAAVKALSEPDNLSRIFLLHGPPGTGKTKTIINIIVKMLQNASSCTQPDTPHPKILLCAPSNTAVDVLVRRLVDALIREEKERQGTARSVPKRRHQNAGHYSVIQVGKKVHHNVKKFNLEDIVEQTMIRNQHDQTCVLDSDNRELITEVTKGRDKLMLRGRKDQQARMDDEPRRQRREALHQLQEELQVLLNERRALEEMKLEIRQKALQRADVICCTLKSCIKQVMQFARGQFDCVIVDEATQCTEPDTLLPLQYGSSKLLLVGDLQQLPATVISKEAAGKNYCQSLFERHYLYFKYNQEIPRNPVWMLNEQFRMHRELNHFPSQHFYGGRVETNRGKSEQRDLFFLHPYLLFDLVDSRERCSAPGVVTNEEEANFLKELCHYIQTELRRCHQGPSIALSIGIITPYQTQNKLLINKFKGLKHVEIGTVDVFQGREKDVILLSCVRTNENTQGIGFVADSKQMNVALTRARYALYVVGKLTSLIADDNWKALISDAKQRNLIRKASRGNYGRGVLKCKKRKSSVGRNKTSCRPDSMLLNIIPTGIQPTEGHDIVPPPEAAVASFRPRNASGENLNILGGSNQSTGKPSGSQLQPLGMAGAKILRPQSGSQEASTATARHRNSTENNRNKTVLGESNRSTGKPSGSQQQPLGVVGAKTLGPQTQNGGSKKAQGASNNTRSRSRSRNHNRIRSRSRSRNCNRSRNRNRSRTRNTHSRNRSRSRGRSRNSSHKRNHNTRNKSRSRSRSRNRNRSRSRNRNMSRSRNHNRSHNVRSRSPIHSRSGGRCR